MTDARFAELAALPTEELRERAFALARQRRDIGFFWQVIAHLPHADDTEELKSDPGMIGASIEDLLGASGANSPAAAATATPNPSSGLLTSTT